MPNAPSIPLDCNVQARAPWRDAIVSASFAFAVSRFIVVLAMALAFAVSRHWAMPEPELQFLDIFTRDFFDDLPRLVTQDDATWYLQVAQHGYDTGPVDPHAFRNWAFFPLHPWLWRVFNMLGIAPWLGGLILANLFTLLGLVMTHRWIASVTDGDTARRGVVCIALFPASYFLSLPFSEPLYFLLTSAALWLGLQRRWFLAAVAAGMSAGTRAPGVLLAPLLWWQSRHDLGLFKRVALGLVATLGLLVFMLVLWRHSGDPLAFAHIQAAWGRDGSKMFWQIWEWISQPFRVAYPWNVIWFNEGALFLSLSAAVWLMVRRQPALGMYTFACVLMPWSGGTLMGMTRYVLVCVPIFLALAQWLRGPNAFLAWTVVSACALAWLTASYTLGMTFAGV